MLTEPQPPAITALVADDIADAMELVAEAGWNQTADDWRFMLRAGHGFGLRDGARVVATCVLLPYRPRIGWIGMVLVGKPFRQRGMATRLLRHAVEVSGSIGVVPMLDATPAGREVYRRIGFLDGPRIQRWRGMGGGCGGTSDADVLDAAVAMDGAALGGERAELIASMMQRQGGLALRRGESVLLARPGRTATHIGPILAASSDDAVALCRHAVAAIEGPVLIDVPEREGALAELLASLGLGVERGFTRMGLGEVPALGETMRAIAGPELG